MGLSASSDANALQDSLQKHLAVPNSQISNLRDSEATQSAIIDAINALTTDARIQRDDPILIFFAGHGSPASNPVGWESGGSEIQRLVTTLERLTARRRLGCPSCALFTKLPGVPVTLKQWERWQEGRIPRPK